MATSSGMFARRASAWQSGLMTALLARRKTAAVFEPEDYVPGDDEAMDDLAVEILDNGHVLFLKEDHTPVGLLVNLSELSVPRNTTNVFGSIFIVPDEDRRRMQLIGICTPLQSANDLADLRNNVPGSRLVRGQQACAQLGVEMKIRRTQLGHSSLAVELDLSEEDLTYLVNLREGTGWDRPLEQLEGFGRTLGQVSDALQGSDSSRSSGGCYIATAVYGSYDAPEVLVLRRYRDTQLSRSAPGRAFIKVYYAMSPPIAKHLRRARVVNRLVRLFLNHVVSRLDADSTMRSAGFNG